jgi:hypothetical protein
LSRAFTFVLSDFVSLVLARPDLDVNPQSIFPAFRKTSGFYPDTSRLCESPLAATAIYTDDHFSKAIIEHSSFDPIRSDVLSIMREALESHGHLPSGILGSTLMMRKEARHALIADAIASEYWALVWGWYGLPDLSRSNTTRLNCWPQSPRLLTLQYRSTVRSRNSPSSI